MDTILDQGQLSKSAARFYFKQIVDGLKHCHDKGIIHRDLKPENMLIGSSNNLKISDFGLSYLVSTPDQRLQTHCGSEKYAAPELLQSRDPYIGPPVDVWSCGVILYVMITSMFPFDRSTMICDTYRSVSRIPLRPSCLIFSSYPFVRLSAYLLQIPIDNIRVIIPSSFLHIC